jgi:hypothetical protein
VARQDSGDAVRRGRGTLSVDSIRLRCSRSTPPSLSQPRRSGRGAAGGGGGRRGAAGRAAPLGHGAPSPNPTEPTPAPRTQPCTLLPTDARRHSLEWLALRPAAGRADRGHRAAGVGPHRAALACVGCAARLLDGAPQRCPPPPPDLPGGSGDRSIGPPSALRRATARCAGALGPEDVPLPARRLWLGWVAERAAQARAGAGSVDAAGQL